MVPSFLPFRPFLENVDHEVKLSIFRVRSLETKGEERKNVVPLAVVCFYFWLLCCCLLVVLLYCGFVVMFWLFGQQQEPKKNNTKRQQNVYLKVFLCWFDVIVRFGVFLFCLILVLF